MIEVLALFGSIFAFGMAVGRYIRCDAECWEQRSRILDAISRLNRTNWREAHRALRVYQAVPRRSHLLALYLGLDPISLYRAAERRLGR